MGEVVILHPPPVTPMRSRRTIKFNHSPTNHHPSSKTLPDTRRQTPPKSILKNRTNTPEAVSNRNTNNMVMGQVKILKRGESLHDETSKNSKDLNRPTISNGPENSEVKISNKKTEKKMVVNSYSRSEVEVLKSNQEVNISSTRPGKLRPDPEVVSKNIISAECFAGSVFSESPPPSSVPLPGFNFVKNNSNATVNLHRILGLNL